MFLKTLGQLLNRLINEQATDDKPRSEIISDMAEAAGIEEGTVSEILSDGIDAPPPDRLAGFARVLDVSVERLESEVDRPEPESAEKRFDRHNRRKLGID